MAGVEIIPNSAPGVRDAKISQLPAEMSFAGASSAT